MSKERELIDRYNTLINMYRNRTINDDNTRLLQQNAYNTLYDLSYYERDNVDNIEDSFLLDRTMIKGIDNIYYDIGRYNRPLDICPPTYQRFDNNKVMVIADLHYTSMVEDFYKYNEESINYVDAALWYAKNNGIKEIVILGDLVDGKYKNFSVPGLNAIISKKTNAILLDEASKVTGYIRKKLPEAKIRVVFGNHDMNALSDYKYKYNSNDIDKAFDEYLSVFKDSDIKIDGVGNTIYSFGSNKLLLEHDINKPFGIYNPLEVEYEDEFEFCPSKLYRSISGHSHFYKYRRYYMNSSEISNVICPCLTADIYKFDDNSDIIEYPGFLIVESVDDKIIVDPYFIIKLSNGIYDIDNLKDLSNSNNSDIPDKIKKYSLDKKIVLNKIVY